MPHNFSTFFYNKREGERARVTQRINDKLFSMICVWGIQKCRCS